MARIRRTDILERRAEIEAWIAEHVPKARMCAALDCRPATLEGVLRALGLSYTGNRGGRRQTTGRAKPAAIYLHYGSGITSHKLKLKILRDGIKPRRCEGCELEEWRGEPIPLELHHVDGDRRNNTLPNLRLLCPNCHALQPGNSGAAAGRTPRPAPGLYALSAGPRLVPPVAGAARVAEPVDAQHLGCCPDRGGGSSPSAGTVSPDSSVKGERARHAS